MLDWSSNDKLAVGLGSDVYIWNHKTKTAHKLFSLNDYSLRLLFDQTHLTHHQGFSNHLPQDNYVTSVKWMNDSSNTLAIGNAHNSILLWDVQAEKCLMHIKQHNSRVSSLAFNNGNILTSGSLNGIILNHDLRSANKVNQFMFHTREICGLKWSSNGRFLASGADDSLVCIWDVSNSYLPSSSSSTSASSLNQQHSMRQPFKVLKEHRAAVKAIDWCPWQNNILATGGGRADGSIKIWNIYNETQQIKSVETNSQISGLLWSNKNRELLSSHGHSHNNLMLWKYPSMEKLGELNGHTNRVLGMAMSADGETVASLAADQTIRFWDCFKSSELNACQRSSSSRTSSSSGSNGHASQSSSAAMLLRTPISTKSLNHNMQHIR